MKKVVIVGAGFSGTLTALHLNRLNRNLEITLLEKTGNFARGVAYSAFSDNFKLNVRAELMGAWPEAPKDFYLWLQSKNLSYAPTDFVPRSLYGKYLQELLAQAEARITLKVGEVVDLDLVGSDACNLKLKNGETINADCVVLATGPAARSEFMGVKLEQRILFDPYCTSSYDDLACCKNILIIGSSLTAIDCLLECETRGFGGVYTVISRHGRFPLAFEPQAAPQTFDATELPSLRNLTREFAKASRSVGSSQPLVDAIRPQLQKVWGNFSQADRKRFLRHLRPLWESHRHRTPPEHVDFINTLQKEGRLEIIAGRLQSISNGTATFTRRSQKNSHTKILSFDRAMLCAGFEGDLEKADSPLLRSLVRKQLLQAGPLRLGAVLRDRNSLSTSPPIYLLGNIQKEMFWEISAVRELRSEAESVAKRVVADLCADGAHP